MKALLFGHLVLGSVLSLFFLAPLFATLSAKEKAEKPIVRVMGINEGGGGEFCQKLLKELSGNCEVLYLPADKFVSRVSFRGGDGSIYYVEPFRIKNETAGEVKRLLALPFKEKIDGVEEEIGKH